MAFLLPPEALGAHLAVRHRDGEYRLPQGLQPLQVDTARVRLLHDWGKRLVDTAVLDPALFKEGAAGRAAAEAESIDTLLAAVDVADDFEPSRSDRTRQAQSQVVKVACVSERTLEYAFKAVLGLTPVAGLIRPRPHRVRQAVLAVPPPRHGSSRCGTARSRSGSFPRACCRTGKVGQYDNPHGR